jgi:hypothetical protein
MGVKLSGPRKLIESADAFAVEEKPGTLLGGIVTVRARRVRVSI